jgi:hypothetical protein
LQQDIKIPESEQEICLVCGFCCDGTLFNNAKLQPGERGTLPELLEANHLEIGEKEYFRLPCPYFNGKCTIYNQKKAGICSLYRCELLLDLEKKAISKEEALNIIHNVKILKKEITSRALQIPGLNETMPFRELLRKLFDLKDKEKEKVPGTTDQLVTILVIKCNILDALLIKHFKSKNDFDKMTLSPEDNKLIALHS